MFILFISTDAGAACYGAKSFPYSVRNESMSEVQVFTVDCFQPWSEEKEKLKLFFLMYFDVFEKKTFYLNKS